MMLNENEALQRMSNIIRTGIDYKSLSENGVSLTTEPYFKSLMCALYKERIHRLLKKSRILLPVTEARLMMGVMDETGLLQDGQVFVQCSHMTSEGDDDEPVVGNRRFVVTGAVMVTRNPCLHPGDVRQLEAVDVPELRHLVDCIVFPRNGTRPHPNEMAGTV
jgi:RNA-dependent RNA polymerase